VSAAGVRGVALFGGAFNPPHLSHERVARQAVAMLPIERLVVLPSGKHPWKADDPELAPAEARLELCRIAFARLPGIEVSDHETRASGRTFTVDTLRHFAGGLRGGQRLYWLIGSDNLPTLSKWERVHEVLRLATLVTYPRAGHPCDARAVEALDLTPEEKGVLADNLLDLEPETISSSDVRARLASRLPVDHLVNPGVVARIEELHLYGT
jgi:nicotinate-nucleotide adenylyltransferase